MIVTYEKNKTLNKVLSSLGFGVGVGISIALVIRYFFWTHNVVNNTYMFLTIFYFVCTVATVYMLISINEKAHQISVDKDLIDYEKNKIKERNKDLNNQEQRLDVKASKISQENNQLEQKERITKSLKFNSRHINDVQRIKKPYSIIPVCSIFLIL